MASSTTGLLFRILFICLAFDVARRFFEKPIQRQIKGKQSEPKKDKYENPLKDKEINTTLDEDDEDNDFADTKKEKKKKEKKEKKIKKEEDDDEEDEEEKEKLIVSYDKKSYQKYFTTFKNEIMGNFTDVDIEEIEYPLPSNKKLFSKFTFVTQMGVSLLIFQAPKIKGMLPMIPPNVFDMIEKNKWVVMIGNFLLHQWLNKFLSTTGAFEVSFRGKNLYSKLASNKLPRESDIHSKLKKILKKSGKKSKKVDNDDEEDDL